MSLDFDITERREGDRVRVSVQGELDYGSSRLLEERLNRLRAESVPVQLDLSRVELIDSAGVSVLVRALNRSRGSDWKLEVERDLPRFIARRFHYLGLDYLLDRQP